MQIFKLLILILLSVGVTYFWPQLVTQTGTDPYLLLLICAVVGVVLLVWVLPRAAKAIDVKAELAAMETRLLAAQDERMANVLDALKEGQGKADLMGHLRLLQGFDPSVVQKIPVVVEALDIIRQIDWPEMNTVAITDMAETIRSLDKLPGLERLVELKARLEGLDLDVLVKLTSSFDTLFNTLEQLQIHSRTGNTRDFSDYDDMVGEVSPLWDKLKPLAEILVDVDVEVLGKKMESLDIIIDTVEEIVLDDDGDAKNFDNLNEGLDNLADFADKVMPVIQKFQQRTA